MNLWQQCSHLPRRDTTSAQWDHQTSCVLTFTSRPTLWQESSITQGHTAFTFTTTWQGTKQATGLSFHAKTKAFDYEPGTQKKEVRSWKGSNEKSPEVTSKVGPCFPGWPLCLHCRPLNKERQPEEQRNLSFRFHRISGLELRAKPQQEVKSSAFWQLLRLLGNRKKDILDCGELAPFQLLLRCWHKIYRESGFNLIIHWVRSRLC